jgi:hypothetical protein
VLNLVYCFPVDCGLGAVGEETGSGTCTSTRGHTRVLARESTRAHPDATARRLAEACSGRSETGEVDDEMETT